MRCDGELPTLVVLLTLKSTLTVQVATRSLSCGDARKGGKFSLLAFQFLISRAGQLVLARSQDLGDYFLFADYSSSCCGTSRGYKCNVAGCSFRLLRCRVVRKSK
jgi:hypothetical protein